jgi:hypothetical protein
MRSGAKARGLLIIGEGRHVPYPDARPESAHDAAGSGARLRRVLER